MNTCPECGAALLKGESCQSIFDSFLALEYSDPGYGEVHLLTVACFMIQHGQYSDAALKWIAQKLRAFLEEGIPAERIRQQAARESGQKQRSWKVIRQAGTPALPAIAWSMTIADVAVKSQVAASYRQAVRQWARVTLREMEPWLARP